ncbi:MAG: hypothetical protein PF572_06055 [Patescibacteria group bacterium]|jgi:uncharacterized protein (UPF0212 family)|nr:hypothetical protein [Patescibacteria group bacterium]
MENGNKKCPFCKEEIKEEAVICKHCNTQLEIGADPSRMFDARRGDRAFRFLKKLIMLVIILAIFFWGVGTLFMST